MSFNDTNTDILDFISRKEKQIKEKNKEIKTMKDEIESIRELCSDNIVVCVRKHEYCMGKDKYSIDKNICLFCGKDVLSVKYNSIVIDMSSYETGFTNAREDIEYKIATIRMIYCDILHNNPNISKENLRIELNKRINALKIDSDSKKKKILEKTL